MADRGRKAFPSANPILTDRWNTHNREMHYERLAKMQGLVDSTEPLSMSFTHLKTNAKRKYFKELREAEVYRENVVLMDKLEKIATADPRETMSPFGGHNTDIFPYRSNFQIRPGYRLDSNHVPMLDMHNQYARKSLNAPYRNLQAVAISAENLRLVKALQNAETHYSNEVFNERWEKDATHMDLRTRPELKILRKHLASKGQDRWDHSGCSSPKSQHSSPTRGRFSKLPYQAFEPNLRPYTSPSPTRNSSSRSSPNRKPANFQPQHGLRSIPTSLQPSSRQPENFSWSAPTTPTGNIYATNMFDVYGKLNEDEEDEQNREALTSAPPKSRYGTRPASRNRYTLTTPPGISTEAEPFPSPGGPALNGIEEDSEEYSGAGSARAMSAASGGSASNYRVGTPTQPIKRPSQMSNSGVAAVGESAVQEQAEDAYSEASYANEPDEQAADKEPSLAGEQQGPIQESEYEEAGIYKDEEGSSVSVDLGNLGMDGEHGEEQIQPQSMVEPESFAFGDAPDAAAADLEADKEQVVVEDANELQNAEVEFGNAAEEGYTFEADETAQASYDEGLGDITLGESEGPYLEPDNFVSEEEAAPAESSAALDNNPEAAEAGDSAAPALYDSAAAPLTSSYQDVLNSPAASASPRSSTAGFGRSSVMGSRQGSRQGSLDGGVKPPSRPASVTGGSAAGSRPASVTGGSAAGSRPASVAAGSQLGSRPASIAAGSPAGSRPGSTPGSPRVDSLSRASNPGSQTGSVKAAGSAAGSPKPPGSRAGSASQLPAGQVLSVPGSRYNSKPPSRKGSAAGSAAGGTAATAEELERLSSQLFSLNNLDRPTSSSSAPAAGDVSGSRHASEAGSAAAIAPGELLPGSGRSSVAASRPASRAGSVAAAVTSRPASRAGSAAGSAAGSQAPPLPPLAGSKAGSQAGSQAGTPAGSRPASVSGSVAAAAAAGGSRAGSATGSAAGVLPSSRPASLTGSAAAPTSPPGSAPGSRPASRAGSAAGSAGGGSRPPSVSGSAAGSAAGGSRLPSVTGSASGGPAALSSSRPGSTAGSRPASRPVSTSGSAVGVKSPLGSRPVSREAPAMAVAAAGEFGLGEVVAAGGSRPGSGAGSAGGGSRPGSGGVLAAVELAAGGEEIEADVAVVDESFALDGAAEAVVEDGGEAVVAAVEGGDAAADNAAGSGGDSSLSFSGMNEEEAAAADGAAAAEAGEAAAPSVDDGTQRP